MRNVFLSTLWAITTYLFVGIFGAAFSQEVPSHIRNAPNGQWTAIGSNHLADVKADLSGAPDGFRKDLRGIIRAWSSAAFDTSRNLFILHGGGHRDYDGNELYAFDIVEDRWIRLNEPSLYDPTDSVNSVFPDGAPVAVHTYDILESDPITGLVYRLARHSSTESAAGPETEIWGFSVATREWNRGTLDAADWPGGRINGSSAWDPVNATFWLASPDQGTWLRFGKFDPRKNTVESISISGSIATSGPVVSALRHRNVQTPMLVSVNGSRTAVWAVGSGEVATPTLTGDLGFQDGRAPGIAYDWRRDVFWIYDESDIGSLYKLNPATWEVEQLNPPGTIPSSPHDGSNGVYGRFRYVPDFDVLVFLNRIDDHVYMFKPSDWMAEALSKPNPPNLD